MTERVPLGATWYRARFGWNFEIEPVLVSKCTDMSVWIGGHRRARTGTWENYFQTWDEAHAQLLKTAEARVQNARDELQRANDKLGNVKGMRKP